MAARSGDLMIFLSTLMVPFLVEIIADAPYTYTEGYLNQADMVFVNCTYNVRGTVGAMKEADLPIKLDTAEAKITYINVENYKPVDQQGTIAKTDGGTGFNYVTFYIKSVETHGFLFHFDIRGTTPPGKTEKAVIGDCRA